MSNTDIRALNDLCAEAWDEIQTARPKLEERHRVLSAALEEILVLRSKQRTVEEALAEQDAAWNERLNDAVAEEKGHGHAIAAMKDREIGGLKKNIADMRKRYEQEAISSFTLSRRGDATDKLLSNIKKALANTSMFRDGQKITIYLNSPIQAQFAINALDAVLGEP